MEFFLKGRGQVRIRIGRAQDFCIPHCAGPDLGGEAADCVEKEVM